MLTLPLVAIVALTFLLALWCYVCLPRPHRIWQIGVALLVACAWPTELSRWVALAGLVFMWLAAMWLIGWATASMRGVSGVR